MLSRIKSNVTSQGLPQICLGCAVDFLGYPRQNWMIRSTTIAVPNLARQHSPPQGMILNPTLLLYICVLPRLAHPTTRYSKQNNTNSDSTTSLPARALHINLPSTSNIQPTTHQQR